MKINTSLSLASLLASVWVAPVPAESAWRHEEIRRFPAPEARQGVAADERFLYVISNTAIGKYDKSTGHRVATWFCPEGEPLIHLNAGVVKNGELWCAHSNYPGVPMLSSIERWNPRTLQPSGSHSFGRFAGSLTWVDQDATGNWFGFFAHYGNRAAEPGKDPSWSMLVQFDDAWQPVQSWSMPAELLEKFDRYSSSGGAFGPDGLLFMTGHDHPELYVMAFPEAGSTLRLVDTIAISAEGQAFCWDPRDDTILYSILKRTREVIVSRITRTP